MAGLSLLPDGTFGRLNKDRAEWLPYHLVSAGAWDRLKVLPTVKWRSAFLAATGSDAVFLAGLDYYGRAAAAEAPDAVYHAVRAWLVAAHVRALIGKLPPSLLAAMALTGDPIAAIMQAFEHPKPGWAVQKVLAAVGNRVDVRFLTDRAAALAEAIPDDRQRSDALAAIVDGLVAADSLDPDLRKGRSAWC